MNTSAATSSVIAISIVISHVSFRSARSNCSVSHGKMSPETSAAITIFPLWRKALVDARVTCMPTTPYLSKVSRRSGSILAFRVQNHRISSSSQSSLLPGDGPPRRARSNSDAVRLRCTPSIPLIALFEVSRINRAENSPPVSSPRPSARFRDETARPRRGISYVAGP
jgi:hypothetical protein